MKEWSLDIAEGLLKTALIKWELPYDTEYELVRLGSNAIYKLKDYNYVVRISKPDLNIDILELRHQFIEELGQTGFPLIRMVKDYPRLVLSGCHVVAWHYEYDMRKNVDWIEFGELIKRFQSESNDLLKKSDLNLPKHNPFQKVRERLSYIKERDLLEEADLKYFFSQCERLEKLYADYVPVLGMSAIHGDAHTGNVITTDKGLVLCDFDEIAIGPKEYDLVPAASIITRFNIDMKNFEKLSEVYGYNLLEDPQADVLVQIRELTMTTWLCQNKGISKLIDREIAYRLETIRKGDRYALWTPM